jgi:cell wall-associated NlpC family hydrolase
MRERAQWRYEPSRKVAKSNLRRGDIVFFKEAGPSKPITHVGIYSGKGNLVHASNYFNKVVESKMRYIKGYFGAKRLRPR